MEVTMNLRVENKPVSRRQFYGTLIALFCFVELSLVSPGPGTAFHWRLEVFVALAAVWALVEFMRTG
jgi:hypothetical protein